MIREVSFIIHLPADEILNASSWRVSAYTKQRKLDPNIASDSGYREDDSAEFATKARRGRSGRFSESIGVIWGTRREGVRWMCSGWRIGVVGGSKGASVEGAF